MSDTPEPPFGFRIPLDPEKLKEAHERAHMEHEAEQTALMHFIKALSEEQLDVLVRMNQDCCNDHDWAWIYKGLLQHETYLRRQERLDNLKPEDLEP